MEVRLVEKDLVEVGLTAAVSVEVGLVGSSLSSPCVSASGSL